MFMNYVNGELWLNKPCFGTTLNFVAKFGIKIRLGIWRNVCVNSNIFCSLPAQARPKNRIIYECSLPPCWQQSGGILVLVSVTTEWFLSAQPSSEKCTGQEISGLFSNSGVSLLLLRLKYLFKSTYASFMLDLCCKKMIFL